ncbi:MAG: 2OG-Fe(II) oxygenase, partial [Rhodanobacteraceae bacterium]
DWPATRAALDAYGHAELRGLLPPQTCRELAALYTRREHFRSRVVMARHGFGQGEYQYFDYPLPAQVQALRTDIYPRLVPLANQWNEAMGIDVQYPPTHADYLARCHAVGQTRPTPLLLQYRSGDYNCLHQDLYGEHVFPLQVAVLLSAPGIDFDGGEFVLTSNDRACSRAPRSYRSRRETR